jgi:PIN domain nuclease of toxin-antitoxin system
MILLDSSALLAALKGEPGADHVAVALATDTVALSAANLAETLTILTVRGGLTHEEAKDAIQELGMKILNVTEEIATHSAEIAARCPRSGLSLGDRLCIATGALHKCRVLSADQAWFALSLGPDIETIR